MGSAATPTFRVTGRTLRPIAIVQGFAFWWRDHATSRERSTIGEVRSFSTVRLRRRSVARADSLRHSRGADADRLVDLWHSLGERRDGYDQLAGIDRLRQMNLEAALQRFLSVFGSRVRGEGRRRYLAHRRVG